MTDLDVLPKDLRARSISDREIVLRLADALAAIDYLVGLEIAVFSWEGWILTPDGRKGHAYWPVRLPDGRVEPGIYHGASNFRRSGQERMDDVRNAAEEVRREIIDAQQLWDEDPGWPGAVLHFCLSVVEPHRDADPKPPKG